jgi:hypothetical protein
MAKFAINRTILRWINWEISCGNGNNNNNINNDNCFEIALVVFTLTLILIMWRIGWAPNSISIYIQQDATLHSLFISGNCSTCFGWYFHPSSDAHTTVSTASGICHTVTAICRYRGRVGTSLSVLWVAYATHSTQTVCNSSTIVTDISNGVTNNRCCRYSCMRSWWYVELPPETCRAVSRYK